MSTTAKEAATPAAQYQAALERLYVLRKVSFRSVEARKLERLLERLRESMTPSQRVAADRRQDELSAEFRASLAAAEQAPARAGKPKPQPAQVERIGKTSGKPPSPPAHVPAAPCPLEGEGSRPSGDAPELLTELEVARLLRVGRGTVERMTAEGKLPQPIRVGPFLRWRRPTLMAWIEAQQVRTTLPAPPSPPPPVPPGDDRPLRPWPRCYTDIRHLHTQEKS